MRNIDGLSSLAYELNRTDDDAGRPARMAALKTGIAEALSAGFTKEEVDAAVAAGFDLRVREAFESASPANVWIDPR